MKRYLPAALCVLLLASACHHKVIKPIPPGQVKKTTAPGQVKKQTGSQSAAPYAPGQQKKANSAKPGNSSKGGKKN